MVRTEREETVEKVSQRIICDLFWPASVVAVQKPQFSDRQHGAGGAGADCGPG